MVTSRDDFVIAIRSAFLKKKNKQKFSLLTLIILSIFIITLSSFNFKIVKTLKSGISEGVYRSSFIVSIPENFIKNSYSEIKEYFNFYTDYKDNEIELVKMKSKIISIEIIKSENKELKELIEDYTLTENKILAKVIVDHKNPFLRTIIINKGSTDKIKIGTNVYDKSYLVGRVIEVNYKSSRVLLLSDINSNVPISLTPGNIQAIIIGNGKNSGEIKYTKDNLIKNIKDQSIAYTSGAGSVFKSGIPVGMLSISENIFVINFYSNFTQLKYVFAEVEQESTDITENQLDSTQDDDNKPIVLKNTEMIKLNMLNEQLEILSESNSKLLEKNVFLESKINQLNKNILDSQTINNIQTKKIDQNNINQTELEFLRLNLIYSAKCQKTIFKKGYKVGTQEYNDCILRKGKKTND
jgi:rod shape-determining protein MreC